MNARADANVSTSYPETLSRRVSPRRTAPSSSTTTTLTLGSVTPGGRDGGHRKVERGTSGRVVLPPDDAVVGSDDRSADGEAHAHARRLRREEGFEEPVMGACAQAGSTVLHADVHRVQLGVPRVHDHGASSAGGFGHRVHPVEQEVHDDLLELHAV